MLQKSQTHLDGIENSMSNRKNTKVSSFETSKYYTKSYNKHDSDVPVLLKYSG